MNTNEYDNVILNVEELIHHQDSEISNFNQTISIIDFKNRMKCLIKLCAIKSVVKIGLYKRLLVSNQITYWFDEFKCYWEKVLCLRPLWGPHDFFFLFGNYRKKFSDLEVNNKFKDDHMKAWSDPRTIYLLFFNQWKLALNPLYVEPYISYIPKGGKILEYGCGAAPITTSMSHNYRHLSIKCDCVDIPTIVFHFVRWKFRTKYDINVIKIHPMDEKPVKETYDTIFCLAVFEHLPKPLKIANYFINSLKLGGFLVFDYILSEGDGLDTYQGVNERLNVIKLFSEELEVVHGNLSNLSNIGTVICRKPFNKSV